ncbi:NUDIX hydrolase [Cupriavidus sp. USMAA2-4]|uniref:NUDIX hydrolase n=1 Tax=Cupriavidus malaysiensis TaxID=367825 RepID=A0ABN4TD89_9BURK|nr:MULTISPECIES: MBL fold metallo-hydrolase [Cupriavidus]AOY91717.1 NUDIX hydrolase [Cupriavidus sp. USMAA2-4]AOY98726.1 NUDIX hydrolase [Cupriavidus sp. USMAHM13]AOZ05158.1 NUDIX hydrolase [Cupriavidus malaysiensis]
MTSTDKSGSQTTPHSLRSAASVLVLRDSPAGPEVLMVRRAERDNDRSSGAYVFPGGTLDAQDRDLHAHAAGLDDSSASQRLGLAAGGLDFYLAAVRECFEEAGLLFAYGTGPEPLVPDQLLPDQLALLRAAARRGGPGLAQACAQIGLRLAVDRLAYHSYWLTPPGLPKRFDTRFFVAIAPPGQVALHDGDEVVEHCWIRPSEAIHPDHGLKLVNATRRNLAAIAHFESAQACFDFSAQRRDIACIMPRIGLGAGGPRPVMPDEACYAEIGRIDPHGSAQARYELEAGAPVRLSERVWRVTAGNGSVMTGPGTNTYLVGDAASDAWAVIDPGPDDDKHVQAVLAAAPGPIRWILATHTHLDHSPATPKLQAATGATVLGRAAPPGARQDAGFAPARELQHGERLALGEGCTLRVVHTPGHASNHLCYLLEEEKTLFTGDHVMQGSTVVINPPDGDMQAYLDSLRALLQEDLEWLAPGHGFLIPRPADAIRVLVRHRLQREAKVVNALAELGAAELGALLARVYDDVPPRMHPVAQRSLLAHLFKLAAEGRARETDGRWQAA